MSVREVHLQTKVELGTTELQAREARYSACLLYTSDVYKRQYLKRKNIMRR